jgi:hypothetical protein
MNAAITLGEAFTNWSRENYKRILVSPKLMMNDVSKDEALRRFIDLPKLFDLLKNGRLIFPKLWQLIKADPFECFARRKFDELNRSELEQKAKELERFARDSAKGYRFPPEITNAWAKLGQGKPLFDCQIQEMSLEELKEGVWYLIPRYEVEGALKTPVGREPMVRSVWQFDKGEVAPRLITAYPLEAR